MKFYNCCIWGTIFKLQGSVQEQIDWSYNLCHFLFEKETRSLSVSLFVWAPELHSLPVPDCTSTWKYLLTIQSWKAPGPHKNSYTRKSLHFLDKKVWAVNNEENYINTDSQAVTGLFRGEFCLFRPYLAFKSILKIWYKKVMRKRIF